MGSHIIVNGLLPKSLFAFSETVFINLKLAPGDSKPRPSGSNSWYRFLFCDAFSFFILTIGLYDNKKPRGETSLREGPHATCNMKHQLNLPVDNLLVLKFLNILEKQIGF